MRPYPSQFVLIHEILLRRISSLFGIKIANLFRNHLIIIRYFSYYIESKLRFQAICSEISKKFRNKTRKTCHFTQKREYKNVKNGKIDINICNFVDKNVFIN